jgi:hypothetical protein
MRRRSSARRPARSCVTVTICRAISAGGDATRGDNTSGEGDVDIRRAFRIGDELSKGLDGTGEWWRWGVGDTGDSGRLSIILGGGGVVIMGEECGLPSFSISACASSSYK